MQDGNNNLVGILEAVQAVHEYNQAQAQLHHAQQQELNAVVTLQFRALYRRLTTYIVLLSLTSLLLLCVPLNTFFELNLSQRVADGFILLLDASGVTRMYIFMTKMFQETAQNEAVQLAVVVAIASLGLWGRFAGAKLLLLLAGGLGAFVAMTLLQADEQAQAPKGISSGSESRLPPW